MKKTTLNRMAMYQNVHAVVNDHQSSWNQIPGIVSVINEFEPLLNSLNNKLKAQSSVTKGIKLEKDSFMTQFIDRLSDLKKGLYLYAVQTNNVALRERNKESRSKLHATSGSRLQVLTLALLEDLDEHGGALTSVGIGSELIQEFRDQALLFEERKNSVRQAIIERTVETKAIDDLEKQLNELLIDQLDRYISLLKASDSDFFEAYKAARRIIGNGGNTGTKENVPAA